MVLSKEGSNSESGWQLIKIEISIEENGGKMELPCITRENMSLSFSYHCKPLT